MYLQSNVQSCHLRPVDQLQYHQMDHTVLRRSLALWDIACKETESCVVGALEFGMMFRRPVVCVYSFISKEMLNIGALVAQ